MIPAALTATSEKFTLYLLDWKRKERCCLPPDETLRRSERAPYGAGRTIAAGEASSLTAARNRRSVFTRHTIFAAVIGHSKTRSTGGASKASCGDAATTPTSSTPHPPTPPPP